MIKFPTKDFQIKVWAHTYKVKLTEQDNLIGNAGDTDNEKCEIRICKDNTESKKWATFFHEVIHTMNGNIREIEVEFMAQFIYQFIIDNKHLWNS